MKLPFFKKEKRKVVGRCPVCGRKIYEDEKYVQFMGMYIHKKCLNTLLKQAMRSSGRIKI